jgi:DNA helicase-2/ATP-dependent DNA helicase PcrA
MSTLRLCLETSVSKFVRTSSGVGEKTFAEIFVLQGTTYADREIPKSAGFQWDGALKHWWTANEETAQKLAQYAHNFQFQEDGSIERFVAPPANGNYSAPEFHRETRNPKPEIVVGTPQQEAFWREIVDGDSHIVLEARAGCGKTFSVVEAAKRACESKIGFSAFNASIAKELKEKVPSNARAFTLHSLGYAAIRRAVSGATLDEDGKKMTSIVESLAPRVQGKPDGALVKAVTAVAALCKAYLHDGAGNDDLESIIARHEVDLTPSEKEYSRREKERPDDEPLAKWRERIASQFKSSALGLVPRVLEECKKQSALVDFDDMIWLPVVLGLPVEEFDLLFIDESQDMNLCQQKLAFMACPRGRIVIVGDPRQSIYAFRGADTRSMARMTEQLEATGRGCKTLPLTFTRRCPKSHVALAQQIVPDIEAMPEAPEGVIENIAEVKLAERAAPGEMILCRTNAPLVGAALRLVRVGKKPLLRGRDLTAAIRALIKRMEAAWGEDPENAAKVFNANELSKQVGTHKTRESLRLTLAGKSASIITTLQDECDIVMTLCEGCDTLAQVDARIRSVFENKDERGAVILSSVHGAKGLEAETVYLLKPELMPHPNATRPEDVEQEMNIKYVAQTRSKSRLVFAHEKPPGDEQKELSEEGGPIAADGKVGSITAELLDVCEAFVAEISGFAMDDDDPFIPLLAQARAAIANARGKEVQVDGYGEPCDARR